MSDYITGQVKVSAYLNREIIHAVSGDPGHALFLHSPDAAFIAADPTIHAAVTTLIGPARLDRCMHAHHNDSPEPGDWHTDDYCGNPWPGEFAIVCYFPQDTPVEMGPTAVRVDGVEHIASGPAGTFIVMRHHIEHRATGNTTDKERLMLKFLYRSTR